MPDKHIPPDWYLSLFGIFWTVLAGVLGAFLRQIITPQQGWVNRILGWVGGGIFSFYATPTGSHIAIMLLTKYDLIDQTAGLSSTHVTGLVGMVSGAIGITFIESILICLKNKFGVKGE